MKRYFSLIVTIFVALAMQAADYTLHVGKNTLKNFEPANCKYTATRDCKVVLECQEVFEVTYNDVNIDYQFTSGSGLCYRYEVSDVKQGGVITATNGFVMNTNSTIKVTLFDDGAAVPVEIANVFPAVETVFPWTNSGMVTVNFNKGILLDKINFVAGDYVAPVEDVRLGTNLGFNISAALNNALREDVLKPGDKFAIKVEGLRDAEDASNLYNGTGELVLEYQAPALQHSFVSAKVGESELTYMQENTYKFLSYYAPEGEDGLFVFEFDGEVGQVGEIYMTMGNLDLDAQGKYHRSRLPYTIEGNKILVDARGTLRTLAVLFPAIISDETDEEGGEAVSGTFDTKHVTICLTNIIDVNGNAFLCDLTGSVGSYAFVMGYEEIIDEVFLEGDNVIDGDVVKEGQEIRLWISNAGIRFDGFSVSYVITTVGDDGYESQEIRVVTVSDYTVEADPVGGIVVSFIMPELPLATPGSTLYVALENARSADGLPHSLSISFKTEAEPDGLTALPVAKASLHAYQLNGMRLSGKSRVVIKDGKKLLGK